MRLAVAGALTVLCAFPGAARAQGAPATGLDLLRTMHDAYRGKWYTSLTFTQQTTQRRPDGTDTVSTWYESLRQTEAKGTELRIDRGDPAAGNGALYSADSLFVVRGGKVAVTRQGGNALLPLIAGVYLQPVERTVAELAPTKVDFSRAVLTGKWNDRPVWIAGASAAADTTSPQIWVDVATKVVVRALLVPVPSAPFMDIRLDGVVPLAGGWLATKCTFYVAGAQVQAEEYRDWKANVDLSQQLFDVTTWTTAPHWAAQTQKP